MPNSCIPNDSPICFFRVDASSSIGIGHVMRCITLARIFSAIEIECIFLFQSMPEFMRLKIAKNNFGCIKLDYVQKECRSSQSFDLDKDIELTLQAIKPFSNRKCHLVIDHYEIDRRWEELVATAFICTLVIDDLADRKHFCDILVDQTFNRSRTDYEPYVLPQTKLLVGSEYALLRPEFIELRRAAMQRRKKCDVPNKVLMNFGGSDIANLYEWSLCVLNKHFGKTSLEIDIVLGTKNLSVKKTQHIVEESALPVRILGNVENMHALMLEADIAIGAAGSSAWERCCLGLPSIMMTVASNQQKIASELANSGAAYLIDGDDREELLVHAMNCLLDSQHYQAQSARAFEVCDGLGANKTAKLMFEQICDNSG